MLRSGDNRKYIGYQYEGTNLASKFVSPRMLNNPRMEGFISKLSPIFINMIDSIKRVQFFFNYTIDKNDTTLNK